VAAFELDPADPRGPRRLRVLVTGCGRSGTKYTAFVLQRLGLDAPHEKLGRDGICSWTMPVETEDRPYGPPSSQVSFEHVFHQVREPLAVIRSAMSFHADSWAFIGRFIDCPDDLPLPLRAARYWLHWNELSEAAASWRYRVEDLPQLSEPFCARLGVRHDAAAVAAVPETFNTRQAGRPLHLAEEFARRFNIVLPRGVRSLLSKPQAAPSLSWEDLDRADPALCARVIAKAREYGYTV
jgi:hypothetical protein